MSTITKEWLQQKIADMEATRDEIPFGLGEDGTNTLAAMKLALASLEAEDKLSSFVASQESLGGDFERVLAENIEELYVPGISVPPAPVSVPDDEQGKPHPVMAVKGEPGFLDNFDRIISERDEDIDIGQLGSSNYEALMLAALDAFRAAMLHGADTELQRKAEIHDALCEKYNVESLTDFMAWQRNHIAELEAAPPAPVGPGETAVMPDYPGYTMTQRECFQAGKKAGLAEAGNPPVIPDGWVACSERMPDIGTEIFYFCQDDGLRDCGIVSSSNFSAKGDAQLYVHAEGYDLRFGVDITHWMPLPATPNSGD